MELYEISEYTKANAEFIKSKCEKVESIKEMKQMLKSNRGYHFRIHSNTQYIFFGDLDNYQNKISHFVAILQTFMKTRYDVEFRKRDFKYTQNNEKSNSYHYSIPKLNASTEKLKEIHQKFVEEYEMELKYKTKKNTTKCSVDTSIYSEHWFRCPNQKKGSKIDDTSIHEIKKGKMKDFVIANIPNKSININNKSFVNNNQINEQNANKDDEIIDCDVTSKQTTETKNNALTTTMYQPNLYKKIFDECYKQERFDKYENWISVAMALKNTFDDEEGFDLFNYFSSKGNNYDGIDKTRLKFQTFVRRKKQQDGKRITVATIYYYAMQDNKPKFIEIMNQNTLDLEEFDMCKYVKLLEGKSFVYVVQGGIYKLYCFDGKIWQRDATLLKIFLSNDLYEFLKEILCNLYYNDRSFVQMKSKIEKLKTNHFKNNVIESFKEVGTNNNIKFDDNNDLLGFDNVVYDLTKGEFREYKYDDYISTTTGYDWREPTKEEIETMYQLIEKIMPNKEERELYLQILCSALDGRCVEHFVVFNGSGGNGKSMMNDMMLLALGKHGMIGNNSILFEMNRTGSNPEKANIHKKRLVIFREPSEKGKFSNSIIKELTGGGMFSARGHHESETQKELNLLMIVECNKKPLFAEEPNNAELRRLIDIYFRSTFTLDITQLNASKNIYLANPLFKEKTFQNKHKYALLKILFDEYKKYKKNELRFNIPKSVIERTQTYLELSCNLVTWFKQNYKHTGNKNDICKFKDLYNNLSNSMYYCQLPKCEKQKYNREYLKNYLQTNIFFKRYYVERTMHDRNFVCEWKMIDNNEDEM